MTNSIEPLCADLRRRIRAPIRSVTFYTHLLLAVMVGGGLGVWYEVFYRGVVLDKWNMHAISAALFTYFPPLVAAALIDFAHERQPYLRSFGLSAAGLFGIIFALAVMTSDIWSLRWSGLGSILAVLFWWVASGEKDCFKDIHPESATGGPVDRELPKSDQTGWKT
jgi:hypothetical protein